WPPRSVCFLAAAGAHTEPASAGSRVVQVGREGILLGKPTAVDLQVVGGGARRIHPQAETCVPHELGNADRRVHPGGLCFRLVPLVFVRPAAGHLWVVLLLLPLFLLRAGWYPEQRLLVKRRAISCNNDHRMVAGPDVAPAAGLALDLVIGLGNDDSVLCR